MGYLKEIVPFLYRSYHILTQGYFSFWGNYFLVVVFSVLHVKSSKKQHTVHIAGKEIYLPNNYIAYLVIYEIFVAKLYARISNLSHVLDLGGYIGDSALFLACRNKKVTVVESDPDNFSYIAKNTKDYTNIITYNKAVVSDPNQKMFIVKDNEYRGSITTQPSNDYLTHEVSTITIAQLLQENSFDGLKMDIEGGEYELISYFIKHNTFPFLKGFIEMHFSLSDFNSQRAIFKNFIRFLGSNGYIYELFDNEGRHESSITFFEKLNKKIAATYFINIYFEKI